MSESNDVLDRMAPRLQGNWDERAAANFILGGVGSGLLAAMLLLSGVGAGRRWVTLLALVLMAGGLTAVWLEIGRPLRALNVYRNARTSWMTREAIVASLAFACGAVAVLFDWPGAYWLAGLFGFAFLYAQARILKANKGIPAWRQDTIVAMIVTTDLAEGAGLLSLTAFFWGELAPFSVLVIGLITLLFLRLIAWSGVDEWPGYLPQLRRMGAPSGTLKVFDAIEMQFLWFGHVAPLVLLLLALFFGWHWLLALAGILALGAGAWFKYVLVCQAAFTQGLALPRTPAHGAGEPGAGDQPGWTARQDG
ncbi:MAG: dimethyl sulfoxide reductase anchor subunit [Alphaproteobacteria bacterium]|nr:dimethyl sulfoxide reductase anchor subunit [Alphaproteobacteria bacterium]